jgi:hypothetical protein
MTALFMDHRDIIYVLIVPSTLLFPPVRVVGYFTQLIIPKIRHKLQNCHNIFHIALDIQNIFIVEYVDYRTVTEFTASTNTFTMCSILASCATIR